MPPSRPDRPFLASWLRRTRKHLAPSGRLSELALILSQREGGTPGHWTQWLRGVLEQEITPSLDELTTIDLILAKPKAAPAESAELLLF